jgi:MFS family permease
MMVGSVSGPAIGMLPYPLEICSCRYTDNFPGPCIGGIIVTFSQWRIIYWLQFGMTLLGLVLSILFVPAIGEERLSTSKHSRSMSHVLRMFNPLRIFRPFIYPNVLLSVSNVYFALL